MNSDRMDEMEKNGVADYWIELREWAMSFFQRNYPYILSSGILEGNLKDERLILRNKAWEIITEEINKIIKEREIKNCNLSDVDIFKGPSFTLSDQQKELAEMKQRIIARLHEEAVAPINYRELLGNLKKEKQK